MKSEKLNLLKNKVVEFHKPDTLYCKGFLYQDTDGYYVKVVEDGDNVRTKDIIRVNEGDDKFITQADKPKLMRISLKSWHYRLIKFVLTDDAPTPKTMQNGCPYFWLLILSIFVAPFKVIGIGLRNFFMIFPEMFDKFILVSTENWLNEIDDKYAYELHRDSSTLRKRLPMSVKSYIKKKSGFTRVYGDDFFETYIEKKYNVTRFDNEYFEIIDKIRNQWYEQNREETKLASQKRAELRKLNEEKRRIAREKRLKWEKKIEPIQKRIDSIVDAIVKLFTIKKDWRFLIKRTKQVVGGLLTLFLLTVSYFVVNVLTLALMLIISTLITYWFIVTIVLGCFAAAGIIYVLYWLITSWVQSLIDKYRRGKKVWYVEAPIYGIYMPLKYLVLGVAFILLWILWKPLEFIGYKILWLLLLFPVGKWVWKGLKKLWNALVGSTGIFGEYFSASYTDYCPGIEWADTDDE